MKKGIAANRR